MSVGPRNRLVECSDCHMLYHQECHKPPILENVNDPRLVWYEFLVLYWYTIYVCLGYLYAANLCMF